ncbi:MAG TPA: DUF485 domain-containing protein [Solirubrobacteraceae bacterium]
MSTHAEPDWAALARSPKFRELMASRRRFLVAGTAFYSLYFLAYLCLLGFAPDTMGKYLFGSVSYALVGGMSLVVLAFVMAFLHARKSDEWERMAQDVLAAAQAAEPRFTKVAAHEGSTR